MEKLIQFETRQTTITVWETHYSIMGEPLYVIESNNTYNKNVRFGNKTQMLGIVKTYWCSVKSECYEEYDKFLNDNIK